MTPEHLEAHLLPALRCNTTLCTLNLKCNGLLVNENGQRLLSLMEARPWLSVLMDGELPRMGRWSSPVPHAFLMF